MDTILSVGHFPDVCRFCLVYASQENPQVPLAAQAAQPAGCRWALPNGTSNETLAQIAITCFGLKIDPDDGLPLNICVACKTALTASFNFRNRCFHVYDILLEVKARHSSTVPDNGKDLANEFQLKVESGERGLLSKRLNADQSSAEHSEAAISSCGTAKVETKPGPVPADADDDEDRQSASAEQPAEDSDDEYERDLADKYESLDQTYHIEAQEPGSSSATASNPVTGKPPNAGNLESALKKPATAARKRLSAAAETSDKLKNQCYICGLIVKRMRQHMSCHPGELQYKCELCPRVYLTKTGRDRHIQRQHPERRYTIDPDGTVVHVNRATQKRLQQRLRYAGKEFIHRNGLVQSARRMRTGCDPHLCRFKCTERLAQSHRQRAFDEYYALADLRKQWQYLSLLCDRTVPKMPVRQRSCKRRPEEEEEAEEQMDEENGEAAAAAEVEETAVIVKKARKMRQNNIRYFLYGDVVEAVEEDGEEWKKADVVNPPAREKVFVCNTMFLATFDIRYGSLATALQKTDVAGNLIDIDRRGRTRSSN